MLQFQFPLHIKMYIISRARSSGRQMTVKLTGLSRIVDPECGMYCKSPFRRPQYGGGSLIFGKFVDPCSSPQPRVTTPYKCLEVIGNINTCKRWEISFVSWQIFPRGSASGDHKRDWVGPRTGQARWRTGKFFPQLGVITRSLSLLLVGLPAWSSELDDLVVPDNNK